jgi:hypothetical protein
MNDTAPTPATPALPPGITEADLLKHQVREASYAAAAAAPLPGPLREAFAGEPRTVGGFTLQPVTAGLVAVLARIQSPVFDVIRVVRAHADEHLTPAQLAALLETEIQSEPEAMIETVFAFVTPAKERRALLDRGRAVWREAAMDRIGDALHPAQLADLERAVGEHFAASFATVVQYEARREGREPGFPLPPATSATASAGGSMSSAS